MAAWKRRIGFVKDLQTQISQDRVFAVAAGVTFYIMLALVPALSVLVSIFGLVAEPAAVVQRVGELSAIMPQEAAVLISEQAARVAAKAESTLSVAATIGLMLAIWSANGGTRALMDALGVAYGVREERGFIRFNLLSLSFTLGAALSFLLLNSAVTLLPVVIDYVWPGSPGGTVVLMVRWPVILLVLMTAIAVLYHFGPYRPARKWQWATPGALVASVGLIVFSVGFSIYVNNFGSYDETYGSLAAAVVTMMWIWLSNVVILIGAEVNATLEGRKTA